MSSEELCAKALELHADRLSSLPNVQGLGIVAGKGLPPDSHDVAVGVYVVKKLPIEDLLPEARIPAELELPESGSVRQIPVRVIEQGPVSAEEFGVEEID